MKTPVQATSISRSQTLLYKYSNTTTPSYARMIIERRRITALAIDDLIQTYLVVLVILTVLNLGNVYGTKEDVCSLEPKSTLQQCQQLRYCPDLVL